MSFTARDLIRSSAPRFLLGDPHAAFGGISIDTRTLRKGDLFFAIPGPHHDGHDHIEDAVLKGAAGVVVEKLDDRVRFNVEHPPALFQVPDSIAAIQQWARYRRSQSQATFIGITGSNGKTTTKEMLAAILSRVGKTLSTRGNLNNHLGLPLTLSQLQPEHRYAVLEMGASRPGDIALLASIARPQVGLITNIGRAHLEGLGSQEGILKEKRAVFDALPLEGAAVINQDDPLLSAAASTIPCRKVFFGMTALADVRAESIAEEEMSVRFTLNVRGQRVPVRLPVPGKFQVLNALAAAAAAHAIGVPLSDIGQGLSAFQPVAMRMQVLSHPSGALLINDAYNANPSSVRASVLGFCQSYSRRPRWLVLGDMRELGGGAKTEHRDLGLWLAEQPLERLFLYGRDTRFIQEGVMSRTKAFRIERFRKKRQLAEELKKALSSKSGPVILFKASRAMQLEQLIHALLPV
jgi:UDP-N-acetylmuramoyl-tripeptide--D-alanyl-D-alanine ligase